MKIEWKAAGAAAYATLGDDATRHTIIIGAWSGSALVQEEPLLRSATPFMETRGNVSGQFQFAAKKSYASLDDAAAAMIAEYGRIGEKGELKITVQQKVVTYANAILRSVARGSKEGVLLEVVYDFRIRVGTIA